MGGGILNTPPPTLHTWGGQQPSREGGGRVEGEYGWLTLWGQRLSLSEELVLVLSCHTTLPKKKDLFSAT